MYSKISFIFLALTLSAQAHDMTPAYPSFLPSYIVGVSKTKMHLFNKRSDANFFEISVYDQVWKSIPFASNNKIIEVRHTRKKSFDVYIKDEDLNRVTYICTTSKLLKQKNVPLIATEICSKVK